jgi:tight adherence protein C
MSETVYLTGIFLLVFLFCLLGLVWLRRHEGFAAVADPTEDTAPPMFGPFTSAIAGLLPSTQAGRAAIQQDLLRAGYYRPTALIDFLALRSLLTWVPFIAGEMLALLADTSHSLVVMLVGAAAALLGFSLPRLFVIQRGKARARQIQHGLPLMLDSLSLCLSAGLNLTAAFRQVSIQLRRSVPVLSEELMLTYQQAQLHSLEHALNQFAARVQVPEVSSLVSLLVQSERLGSDAAPALQELASTFRTNMRQRAEAQANRANFFMLLPTVGCLLIAAAILLVGPGALQAVDEGQQLINAVNSNGAYVDEVQRIWKQPLPGTRPRTPPPSNGKDQTP